MKVVPSLAETTKQHWGLRHPHRSRASFPDASMSIAGYLPPQLGREIMIGLGLATVAGVMWKRWHWQEKRKVDLYYQHLEQQREKTLAAKALAMEAEAHE